MGNLRDGGIIIVGVSERDDTWQLSGILKEHLETYDVDDLIAQVNSYVSPHIDLTLVSVNYSGGQEFLAIEVGEFADTPLVCKKNGPNPKDLSEGSVYIRSFGKPETTRVTRAEQMHDLLELAAEKRARRILEVSRRVGLVLGDSSIERFDKEIQNIESQLPVPILEEPYWHTNLRPEFYEVELISSLSECLKIVNQSRVKLGGWGYPSETFDVSQRSQGATWISGWSDLGRLEYWRFYQSAQFLHLSNFWDQREEALNPWRQRSRVKGTRERPQVSGYVSISEIIFTTTGVFEFAARLCEKGIFNGQINLIIYLKKADNFILFEPNNLLFLDRFYKLTESSLRLSQTIKSDDLVANSKKYAIDAAIWFVERFGWHEPPANFFEQKQRDLFSYN